MKSFEKIVFNSTGRDQSSLCDTQLYVCPSVRLTVRLFVWPSVRLHTILVTASPLRLFTQRLLYSPSLLALWCSCAPAVIIMILSPGA